MMDEYIKALIDLRDLLTELERETQIVCERRKFRDNMFHGMYIGYSTSIHILNSLIREHGAEKVQ